MTQPIFHSTRVTSKCESAFAGVHHQPYIDREGANANEGDVPFHACKRVPHPFTNAVEVSFAAVAAHRPCNMDDCSLVSSSRSVKTMTQLGPLRARLRCV